MICNALAMRGAFLGLKEEPPELGSGARARAAAPPRSTLGPLASAATRAAGLPVARRAVPCCACAYRLSVSVTSEATTVVYASQPLSPRRIDGCSIEFL